jgi:hypothetical protein
LSFDVKPTLLLSSYPFGKMIKLVVDIVSSNSIHQLSGAHEIQWGVMVTYDYSS